MKAFIILVMTVLVLSASAPEAVAQDPTPRPLEVHEHTLANGLRLFILPRHGVPIASFVVQYKIGGVNETPGNTGIAHFLEHMAFKGTTSRTGAPFFSMWVAQAFRNVWVVTFFLIPDRSTHRLTTAHTALGSIFCPQRFRTRYPGSLPSRNLGRTIRI